MANSLWIPGFFSNKISILIQTLRKWVREYREIGTKFLQNNSQTFLKNRFDASYKN